MSPYQNHPKHNLLIPPARIARARISRIMRSCKPIGDRSSSVSVGCMRATDRDVRYSEERVYVGWTGLCGAGKEETETEGSGSLA